MGAAVAASAAVADGMAEAASGGAAVAASAAVADGMADGTAVDGAVPAPATVASGVAGATAVGPVAPLHAASIRVATRVANVETRICVFNMSCSLWNC